MRRAINAAAEALHKHEPIGTPEWRQELARIAITAAYPHLFQTLTKENRELRNKLKEHNGKN